MELPLIAEDGANVAITIFQPAGERGGSSALYLYYLRQEPPADAGEGFFYARVGQSFRRD